MATASRRRLSITVGCASTTTHYSYASCSKHVLQGLSYASGCCWLSDFLGRRILRLVLWGVCCWQSKLAATRLSGLKLHVSICGIMAQSALLCCSCSALPHEEDKHVLLPPLPFVVDYVARTSRRYSTTDPNQQPSGDQLSFLLCVSVDAQLTGFQSRCSPTHSHTSERTSPSRICFCTG